MDDAAELSIAYLRRHPAGAARALSQIAPQDAAAFATGAPDSTIALALGHMQPASAVRVLEHCEPETAAALLLEMTGSAQAAVLRALSNAVRGQVLNAMPKRKAAAMRRLLAHAAGSVGAWMEATQATFRPETTVADCLQRVRSLPSRLGGIVYLTDDNARLRGSVDIDDVLAAADTTALGDLTQRKTRTLHPQASLSSVMALSDWDSALSLPVVDRGRRLLGVLSFESLREGLAADRAETPGWQFNVLLLHVAQAFLVSLSGLLQVAATEHGLSRLTTDEDR